MTTPSKNSVDTGYISDRMARDSVASGDLVYIPQFHLVFAFISKNASSLMKTYFTSLANGMAVRPPARNPHVRTNTGFLSEHELGATKMAELLADPSIPKIVLGRDPVSRLVSAWNSRVHTWTLQPYQSPQELRDWVRIRQEIAGHSQDQHAAPARASLIEKIPFATLVDYVAATPSSLLDRHLAPQTFLCASHLIEYSLVGRVEEMDSFLSRLSHYLPDKSPPLNDLVLNASHDSSLHASAVSADLRARIYRRYLDDYTFFGYPIPDGVDR